MKFVFKQKAKHAKHGESTQKHGESTQSTRKHGESTQKQGERLPVSGGLSHVVINTILRTI